MGRCYNSMVIDAPIEQVWNLIKDFHRFDWGKPVIARVVKVGDIPGTEVGAKRILNEVFHETLVAFNADEYTFSYSIDNGPDPFTSVAVSDYIGRVNLFPVTDTGMTFVQWASTYRSENDQAVGDFCNPVYAGLLSALKASF